MTADVLLTRWAARRLGNPFEWGRTDCALLALEAIDLLRGSSAADAYRNRWHDAAGALRHFGKELPSGVLERLGLVPVPAASASSGDVLVAPKAPFPETLGVVVGRFAVSAEPATGVCLVKMAELLPLVTSAWRVP